MAASRKSTSTDRVVAAVAGCLERHMRGGQSFAVGLSGGVDSVVLLHRLRAMGVEIVAVHVHHGLSPAADSWETFCRDLCASWGVRIVVERVAVERGSADGLEAAARRARHDAFLGTSADWLALAHHRGDRSETLLFNLLRGAGLRGAGAMAERTGRLLRPLLAVGRADILGYANDFALRWVEDTSNTDTRFARNFLRHTILPELKSRFPAAEAQLAKAAGHFAEAGDLLDELAVLDLGGRAPEFPVSVDVLGSLSEPRARNVLRMLLARHGVGVASEQRLVEALRQCLTAGPDRHPAVSFGGWELVRQDRQVILRQTQ